MKHLLVISAIVAMSAGLIAQNLPIDFDTDILAQTQGLGKSYALYSADSASEILFNPALAAQYQKRFLYMNYASGGSSFSGATAFKTEKSWWLFQFAHDMSLLKDVSSSDESRYYVGLSDSVIRQNNYSSDETMSQTTFKISRARMADDYSSSYGIFAIIRPNSRTSSRNQMDNLYLDSTYTHSTIVTDLHQDMSLHAVGIEYAINTGKYDFVTRLSVQQGYDDYKLSPSSTTGYRHDSSYASQYSYSYNESEDFSSLSSPLSVLGTIFYQKKTAWITPSDNVFLSLQGYIVNQEITYHRNYFVHRYEQSGTDTYSDTIRQDADGSLKPTQWGAALSLGYVLRKHLTDIDWFVSVNPIATYDKYAQNRGYSQNYLPYANTIQSLWINVSCPFYLKFSPVNWFSVFGGIVYTYSYMYRKTTSEAYSLISEASNTTIIQNYPASSTDQRLNSSSKTFLGVNLMHQSGLNVQIQFSSSIASSNAWYISVGYLY